MKFVKFLRGFSNFTAQLMSDVWASYHGKWLLTAWLAVLVAIVAFPKFFHQHTLINALTGSASMWLMWGALYSGYWHRRFTDMSEDGRFIQEAKEEFRKFFHSLGVAAPDELDEGPQMRWKQ